MPVLIYIYYVSVVEYSIEAQMNVYKIGFETFEYIVYIIMNYYRFGLIRTQLSYMLVYDFTSIVIECKNITVVFLNRLGTAYC